MLPDATQSFSFHKDDLSFSQLESPGFCESPRPQPYELPSLVSLPSSIDEFHDLERRQRTNSEERRQYDLILPYVRSSLVTGRHMDRAVILTMGVTGHGQSKTINCLVGRDVFPVANTSSGSITEVVQRTSVRSTNHHTGVSVTVSFDDTPGLKDTKSDNNGLIDALMRNYGEKYYPTVRKVFPDDRGKIYPNIIMLVASWDSIKRDANEPANFTSSIGKTMYSLSRVGLFDVERPNVIVVVTKALTFWSDYERFSSEDEKNGQWKRDADEKAEIINNIRSKIFPSSKPWEIVFVENGGGQKIFQANRKLPNDELSHQNLFDAILRILGSAEDLVGTFALQAMVGALRDSSRSEPTDREVLWPYEGREHSSERKGVEEHEPAELATIIHSNLVAAKARLGYAYNPLSGNFGSIPIVVLNDSDIHITLGPLSLQEPIADINTHAQRSTFATFKKKTSLRRTGRHNSSDATSLSSTLSAPKTFETTIFTSTVNFPAVPSQPICRDIYMLPRWNRFSDHAKAEYCRFFEKHGTHINVQVVLGGVSYGNTMRYIDEPKMSSDSRADINVAMARRVDGRSLPHDISVERHSTYGSHSISALLEGQSTTASDLTSSLKDQFGVAQKWPAPSNYIDVRPRQAGALQADPGLCTYYADHQYEWLFKLAGITSTKRRHLQRASEWYLTGYHLETRNNSLQAAIDAHDSLLSLWIEKVKQWLCHRSSHPKTPKTPASKTV